MRKIFLALFLVLVIVVPIGMVRAEDGSGSAVLGEKQSSPSGSIMEKLNILKTEIASRAAEIKAKVSKTIQNRAWSGVIQSKSDSMIVITSPDGPRNIGVNEYTLYTTSKVKDKGTLKELVIGDFVVGIGDVDDKNVLQAKKVIRAKPVTLTKQLVWGQINGVSNWIISLKTTSNSRSLKVNDLTRFWLGSKEASIADAKKDKFLLAVVEGSGSGSLASTVYFIPQIGYFKPEKKASPSAKLSSPTPAASKSATKK